MHIEQASDEQLQTELNTLEADYSELAKQQLALDLTRGKPSSEQVELSSELDGILAGNYLAADGTDTRNYGGIEGLPEARALFAGVLGCKPEEVLIGGNSSLSLMYTVLDVAMRFGLRGPDSAWQNNAQNRFLCPAPGYDRHFAVCEHLGIDMVPVPMLDSGPDMAVVEAMVASDDTIRGIWCVPRFSNPTGCVYDDDTVERMAALAKQAAGDFLVMWDNAYAVHALSDVAPQLAPISDFARSLDTADSIVQFGSTSKVTFAGAGVAFLASGASILGALKNHLGYQTIGPDKVNQLRHVRLLRDDQHLAAHMAGHAALIAPRFDVVLNALHLGLSGRGMGRWTQPQGGYFIAFDTRPGLAAEVVRLAADIGVKLTPAGATFPYGKDPEDCNIRLAPTYPTLPEVQAAADAFVVCVKLASIRQKLG
ncbi:MAG: aminotransferase class I/II-fold pyridoxal phosphate-dependent enzyme [Halieaceae bacterium]